MKSELEKNEDAIAKAVQAERSRCAKICDDYIADCDNEWNRSLGIVKTMQEVADDIKFCILAIVAR